MKYSFLIGLIFLLTHCTSNSNDVQESLKSPTAIVDTTAPVAIQKVYEEFDRTPSFDELKRKIASNEPLVIHARVPLCDNDNQGITPVSKLLGNGFDLRNNLYWGAKYGVKHYFKSYTDWTLLESIKDVNSNILERLIFHKKHAKGSDVYFIADAYRGDKMKPCLVDFFNATAGRQIESIQVNDQKINISSQADLLIFNGHNGLMDTEVDYIYSKDEKIREVAVIGCVSHSYFKPYLKRTKGYPLLMTTNLMAPEAYVMEAVIESWLNQKRGDQIRVQVGQAYHKFQKCGLGGATRLFQTNW